MSSNEVLLCIFFVLIALCFLGYLLWKDRSYLKKKTKDVLGSRLSMEINAERQAAIQRKKKFEDILRNHQI